jgi:hypothetical protein
LIDFIYLYETELKKTLPIALGGVGRGLRGRDDDGNVNNVQYKSDWNCHFRSPSQCNEYILIKTFKNNNKKSTRAIFTHRL